MSEAITCPVCRAGNDKGPACRRCKADLSLLFQLRGQRERALAAAYREAARGRWGRALDVALGAEALRGGEDVRRLLALGCLMRRDFARAWGWYAARTNSASLDPA